MESFEKKIFQKLSKMKFGILKTSVGHILINILLCNPQKEKIILFYADSKSVNKTLISILQKTYRGKIIFVQSKILSSIVYRMHKSKKKYFNWFKKYYINTYESHISPDKSSIYGSKYKVWDKSIRLPEYVIPEKIDLKFNRWLKISGIGENYICVYTRDPGFYPADLDGSNRNSKFENLFPAIEFLISQGFSIVRIGREASAVHHTFDPKKYFDINSMVNCPEYVDVMLFKYAKLVIGSNSGIMNISLLFDTPVLACNWHPLGIQPFFPQCRYILKKYLKNGRSIDYIEVPQEILLCESRSLMLEKGYDVIENSKDEILDFISRNVPFRELSTEHNHKYEFIVYGGNAVLDQEWEMILRSTTAGDVN